MQFVSMSCSYNNEEYISDKNIHSSFLQEFPKYSIGFVRYEMSEDKEVTFDQFAWENLGLTPFVNEESGSYHDHPLRFKYLKNLIFPYQGM